MSDFTGAMLDTSVWVAVFEGEPASDELASAQGDLVSLTSPIVLAELASLGARGRASASSITQRVLDATRLEPLTAEDAIDGGHLHGRLRRHGNTKVGLGDCLIYATARRLGAKLLTCDADLAEEPGVTLLAAARSKRRRA